MEFNERLKIYQEFEKFLMYRAGKLIPVLYNYSYSWITGVDVCSTHIEFSLVRSEYRESDVHFDVNISISYFEQSDEKFDETIKNLQELKEKEKKIKEEKEAEKRAQNRREEIKRLKENLKKLEDAELRTSTIPSSEKITVKSSD